MTESCHEAAVSAWVQLVRVEQALLARVEGDLKAHGFPPLTWYDVLLELSRAEEGRLRPVELERRLLLPQSNTSRLVDRMERDGLVRREACPSDGRGQWVALTQDGRALRERMWPVYRDAIGAHVGAKLDKAEAATLARLLAKLL
ncbi:MarR family transcriptional regulator [uncultured Alsobacter sp.]|uniref:MarR family winged helix-turn-helix transcriptional regulator n=1 Tax=uncultured Alsobacter sp. TaxID=1748258 RepID=UPI0025CD92FD|nr:MarR family transcriptional regulator [uncultured Alsobacter sp.]